MKAFFIGRFQPFHRGHMHAVQDAMDRYDLTIGIGSAQEVNTLDNPLATHERRQVLNDCVPTVPVIPVPDRFDNDAWLDHIEAQVDVDAVISGNDLVRRLFRERGYTVEEPAYREPDRFEGTTIRDLVIAGEAWQDRVPDCALPLLEEFGFAERLRMVHDREA